MGRKDLFWNRKYEDMENTAKDVESIKDLAFSIPDGLPSKLEFFWVAKVLAVLARFILVGVIEFKDDFTAYDAKKILYCFLSATEMDMPFNLVKARINNNSFMLEEFKVLLDEVMAHKSLTENLRCKHRTSLVKRIFSSPFCDPCLEEDRRMRRKKDIILMSIFGSKLNLDVAMKQSLEKSSAVSGAIQADGVTGPGVSGSMKRSSKDDLEYSAKRIKK